MEDKEKAVVLWESYTKSQSVEDRDQVIVHYLYLVKFVVARLAAGLPKHVKHDDLYSSGVTGLIKAVERYDPEKNNKFETYAVFLIKGAIIDEMRQLDWIPRSVHQKAGKISEAQSKLQQKLGREPSDEELAYELKMSEEELQTMLARVRPAILIPLNADFTSSDEEGAPIAERIPDVNAETSYDVADRNEHSKILEQAIDGLNAQEKKVLTLYYYEEMMLKEIGKVLGVTEGRVSQIHTKALLKLRGRLGKF